MSTEPNNSYRGNNKETSLARMFLYGILMTIFMGCVLYFATSAYVLKQAEKNVQNLLLSHKGIHLYVQRTMLPALYNKYKGQAEDTDEAKIPADFYAPELFSSSFIVRNQHIFYNEERRNAGLPELYYKMAATNPRNPVNMADAREVRLIQMFNENRDVKKYREIIEIEGKKYLYFALPFLENKKYCLRCHGKREDAPRQLQEQYSGPGGFNEKEGEIRAIISIRSPLEKEFFTVYIITAALISGVLAILFLFFFNNRLIFLVKARTNELENEVNERKKAEAEVRELNVELENRVAQRTQQLTAANKELDSFAYSVSHDLRAPLRGIDGFSAALLEDYEDQLDEKAREYLNRVRAACVKMGSLIEDILRLSRLTRGEITRKRVDLSVMAASITEELKLSDPERHVDFRIKKDIIVNADESLMHAVMENLLNNSWKFTRNKPEPIIEVGEFEKEGRRIVFVCDNGAGFNMDYADKLFGAFQRLHTENEFEGTGIGLATVQRIIHRHGGEIWAEGKVDMGATFYFTL